MPCPNSYDRRRQISSEGGAGRDRRGLGRPLRTPMGSCGCLHLASTSGGAGRAGARGRAGPVGLALPCAAAGRSLAMPHSRTPGRADGRPDCCRHPAAVPDPACILSLVPPAVVKLLPRILRMRVKSLDWDVGRYWSVGTPAVPANLRASARYDAAGGGEADTSAVVLCSRGAMAAVVPAPRVSFLLNRAGHFRLTAAVCPPSIPVTAGRARSARPEADVRCACGSSGAAGCGAGGVMAWARGRGEGARGRGGR